MHAAAESIWQQVMALGVPSLAQFSVEILPEIDSTNSELMRRCRARRTEPTLLVAQRQTAGRGRLGRHWATAQNDAEQALTFSLGLALAPSSWDGLSLIVGLSIAESLHPALQLKWPNDLWYQGRKLGGILVETANLPADSGASSGSRFVVIGIGLNISLPASSEPLRTAPAALQELVPQSSTRSALVTVFPGLLANLLRFEREGLAPFMPRYVARDALYGKQVLLSDGLAGTAQGVDGSGALLVHTSQGLQRITSLEVSVRPAA